jgi:hypothetical protein
MRQWALFSDHIVWPLCFSPPLSPPPTKDHRIMAATRVRVSTLASVREMIINNVAHVTTGEDPTCTHYASIDGQVFAAVCRRARSHVRRSSTSPLSLALWHEARGLGVVSLSRADLAANPAALPLRVVHHEVVLAIPVAGRPPNRRSNVR